MKQWLTIFLTLWATATLAVAEEPRQYVTSEIHATILTEQQSHTREAEDNPLLATPTAARQLSGVEQAPARPNRSSYETASATTRAHCNTSHLRTPTATNNQDITTLTGVLSPDRYIYYLRKIII